MKTGLINPGLLAVVIISLDQQIPEQFELINREIIELFSRGAYDSIYEMAGADYKLTHGREGLINDLQRNKQEDQYCNLFVL